MPQNFALSQRIVHHVTRTHHALKGLVHKKPQPDLNRMLQELVEMVRPVYDAALVERVLSHHEIKNHLCDLRCQLAECETELEKHWAEKIIRGEAVYTDYPYMDSYRALIKSEVTLLNGFAEKADGNFCFVGSGPLPITVFELLESFPKASFRCVDFNQEAIDLARQIDARFVYQTAAAQDVDYGSEDVIILASMTIAKQDVLQRIVATAKDGAIICIRSVEELRHLLYEPVDPGTIPTQFVTLGQTPYRPEQINTSLFYRLKKS